MNYNSNCIILPQRIHYISLTETNQLTIEMSLQNPQNLNKLHSANNNEHEPLSNPFWRLKIINWLLIPGMRDKNSHSTLTHYHQLH